MEEALVLRALRRSLALRGLGVDARGQDADKEQRRHGDDQASHQHDDVAEVEHGLVEKLALQHVARDEPHRHPNEDDDDPCRSESDKQHLSHRSLPPRKGGSSQLGHLSVPAP